MNLNNASRMEFLLAPNVGWALTKRQWSSWQLLLQFWAVLFVCSFVFSPNQACLWGSYSNERISVSGRREGGSPITLGPVPPKILVPRSWYQDLGTRILVPRSLGEPVWYAGETPLGGRGPSEIVLVRTNAEKGR